MNFYNVLKKTSLVFLISFCVLPLFGMEILKQELQQLNESLNTLLNQLTPKLPPQLLQPEPILLAKLLERKKIAMPEQLLYTRVNTSWEPIEFYPNFINDLSKKLGIPFKRVEPYDSELNYDSNALYLYVGGPTTDSKKIDELTRKVSSTNGHLLLVFTTATMPQEFFKILDTRVFNGVSVFYFRYDSNGIVETTNYQQEINELRASFVVQPRQAQQQKPTTKPLEIKRPSQQKSSQQRPQQQQTEKIPGKFLYTRVNESWGPFDFFKNPIEDLSRILGITLERVEPNNSRLVNNPQALYFYIVGGRPASSEEAAQLDKFTKEISSKNGRFLIVFNYSNDLQGFRTLESRVSNGVSVFYFKYYDGRIIKTTNYDDEMSELRAALGK